MFSLVGKGKKCTRTCFSRNAVMRGGEEQTSCLPGCRLQIKGAALFGIRCQRLWAAAKKAFTGSRFHQEAGSERQSGITWDSAGMITREPIGTLLSLPPIPLSPPLPSSPQSLLNPPSSTSLPSVLSSFLLHLSLRYKVRSFFLLVALFP